MLVMRLKNVLTGFILITSILSSTFAFSQEEMDEDSFRLLKKTRVSRVRNKLYKINKEILKLNRKIKKERNENRKTKLYEDVDKLKVEYQSVELTFIGVSTDIHLDEAFNSDNVKKPDLFEEIMEILKPALESIKRVSQKPRKIENLRSLITKYSEKLSIGQAALSSLKTRLKATKFKSRRTILKRSISRVSNLIEGIQIKLETNQVKLHKQLSQETSLFYEMQRLGVNFLKTKGKNIFISLLIFLLALWPLRHWRVNILNLLRKVIIKYDVGDTSGSRDWLMRPISVLYTFFSFLMAAGFGMFTLYVLNDWVLVTTSILIFTLLIWSLKEKIPQFIEQFKMILNFGSVREKERVIWNGIPWRVRKLGLYCTLENPSLQGGILKVHSRDIMTVQSRVPARNESWFPSNVNEWVLLSDGIYGQVQMQTPEQICIKLIGGALKYYPTNEFLGLCPVNLSYGYQLSLEFGLDYGLQSIIVDEVVNKVKDHFYTEFKDEFLGANPKFKKLIVEFDNAGASALNLRVNLDISGSFAGQKLIIARFIQKELVKICNTHQYNIPFNQLTVHMNS